MATFKVGQRVRIIAHHTGHAGGETRVGRVEKIMALSVRDCAGELWDVELETCFGMFSEIAPLTDPLADAFLERIKRLEREPMPLGKVLTHKLSEDFYKERA